MEDKTLDGDIWRQELFKFQGAGSVCHAPWLQGLYPVQCIYGGVPKRDQREVHFSDVARRFEQ